MTPFKRFFEKDGVIYMLWKKKFLKKSFWIIYLRGLIVVQNTFFSKKVIEYQMKMCFFSKKSHKKQVLREKNSWNRKLWEIPHENLIFFKKKHRGDHMKFFFFPKKTFDSSMAWWKYFIIIIRTCTLLNSRKALLQKTYRQKMIIWGDF